MAVRIKFVVRGIYLMILGFHYLFYSYEDVVLWGLGIILIAPAVDALIDKISKE